MRPPSLISAPVEPIGTHADGQLAGHRLLRRIGHGGLARLYVASDPAGATVALKVFDLHGDTSGAIADSFRRETEVGRRLVHPDIVRTLAAGLEGPYAYIAMEFVRGTDLAHYASPTCLLPLPVVLRTLARVAGALAQAHTIGVLHRDVKPGNVLVDFDADIVKVADFGLARVGDAFRSLTGMISGTPHYMSPEQLAEGELDARSDLYALGVMLFELATGRRPHQAESMGQFLRLVSSVPAPDLRSVRPDVPDAVATLAARLLQIAPARRPADARTVAEELASLGSASDDPTASDGPGPMSRR